MDRFQEMSSFVAVVESGSFVAAADATGLSKAAVSRHVADLELRLGARLLHRTTRRLSLTDDGRVFYAHAKELLGALDEAESEISARRGEPSGTLRINAPLTFGILHLAPLWGRFIAANPKVALDISLSDRVVDLAEEGYDVAVRITNMANSALIGRKLADTRMMLCASPTYLKRRGTPRQPSDLAQHQIISYSYWSGGDQWEFVGPDGARSVRVSACIHTNNGDTCRAAALDHQGVILQPDFLVGRDLHSGALVELMPQFRAAEIGIHALYLSRKHLSIKVRRLVDFLAAAFKQPPWNRTKPDGAPLRARRLPAKMQKNER
ncbi:MAG TPA: LysR family transcriptional regulator [Rudaea sp.]|jgi:DNA-binding transcriptional LysR family regulator|nr:LysR family transcriptional regulator [Rudaea sp.]